MLWLLEDNFLRLSSHFLQYLFREEKYDKPFFTVYFKTVLFSIYLLPFLFWRPWQRLCCPGSSCQRSRSTSSSNYLNHKGLTKVNFCFFLFFVFCFFFLAMTFLIMLCYCIHFQYLYWYYEPCCTMNTVLTTD